MKCSGGAITMAGYIYETSAEYFAEMGIRLAKGGARIIGGCCGATPFHIAALAKALG